MNILFHNKIKMQFMLVECVDTKCLISSETVKEVLVSWRGSFVGKKRKKTWDVIPLCIFWTVWKERNRLAFRGWGGVERSEVKEFFCL